MAINKRTRLEGDPRDSKYWHRRLPREQNSRSKSSAENLGDEKIPYILQSEVENAIKEMRTKKATGDDDVPGDVLKLLGKGGLK